MRSNLACCIGCSIFCCLLIGSSNVFGDIGKNSSHFSSSYGASVGQSSTSTGTIGAWKMQNDGVVMAEFGPDGRARNVVYRVKGALDESAISRFLSKNSTSSGSFHRVDMPQLTTLLASLPRLASDPNAPEEVRKFAQQMPPQAVATLQQTIAGVGDLRATKDGKYVAMIDSRGQVLVLEINGPSLPLLN